MICSMLALDCAERRSQKKDHLDLSEGPIKKDGLSKISRETTNERPSNIAQGEDKKERRSKMTQRVEQAERLDQRLQKQRIV